MHKNADKFDTYFAADRFDEAAQAQLHQSRMIGFRDAVELVRRHIRFILYFIAIGTALAILAALTLTRIYTASSTLVFDRNDTRPYEAVVELQKQERDRSAMETELDVIASRVFVGTVVDSLNLIEDPIFNTFLPKPPGWLASWFGNFESKADPNSIQKRILSETVQRDRAITNLLSTFTATRSGESLAMTIRVQHINPAQAAIIANAIAARYVEWSTSLKEAATIETVQYLRNQSNELAQSIADKERQIAAFATTNDLTFDPRDDLLRARVEQLNEQLTLARVDEASAIAKFNEVKQLLEATGTEGVGRILTSELLTQLRTEQSRLQGERAQLGSKFARNHPDVVKADAEITSNRKMIEEEIQRIVMELDNSAKVATVRVRKFEDEIATMQERMADRNLAEIRRRELERDLLSEQKRYDQVILRLGTLNPDQEEVKATARIASYAEVPTKPTFPKPGMLVAAGFAGSTILALILAFVLEAFDSTLRRIPDIEAITQRPNIVRIPDVRAAAKAGDFDTPAYLHQNPGSTFAEAMRSLCLAWRTIGEGKSRKIVMIASAAPGEGKTTTALGMATVAAMNGLRVMLLDLDPKDDGAAAVLNAEEPDLTLAEFLGGQHELPAVIARVPGEPFLDVISERLSVQEIDKLFMSLRREYDLIVVDTPAIQTVDDAIWLSPHIDSIVMVVSFEATKEQDFADAIDRLRVNNAPILGSVLNRYRQPAPIFDRAAVLAFVNRVLPAQWKVA